MRGKWIERENGNYRHQYQLMMRWLWMSNLHRKREEKLCEDKPVANNIAMELEK